MVFNYYENVFEYMMDLSDSFDKHYLLNHSYFDSLVLGLSWLQASRFIKWLADRYYQHGLAKRNSMYGEKQSSV